MGKEREREIERRGREKGKESKRESDEEKALNMLIWQKYSLPVVYFSSALIFLSEKKPKKIGIIAIHNVSSRTLTTHVP